MKSRRYKVQCGECSAIFNSDDKSQHETYIHNGNIVSVKTVDASANPFEAACAKKRRLEESPSSDIAAENECQNQVNDVTENTTEKLNPLWTETQCPDKNVIQQQFSSEIPVSEKIQESVSSATTTSESVTTHVNIAKSFEKSSLLIQTSDQSSNLSWTNVMGDIKCLLDKCSDTRELFDKYSKQEIVNEKLAVSNLMDYIMSIEKQCGSVMKKCKDYITKEETVNVAAEGVSRGENLISHDPALRPSQLTDKQKDFLIKIGPHQPFLATFPSNGRGRFNPKWYMDFQHLEYSIVKDCAYCFVCFLFPHGVGQEGSNELWSRNGVNNWKKMLSVGRNRQGRLQAHFSSSAHRSALYKYRNFLVKQQHADVLLNK